jgi:hypothetical protein
MRLLSSLAGVACALALAACADGSTATEGPTARAVPRLAVVDASSSTGTPGFHFAPPIAPVRSYYDAFDATQSPVVEVCVWTGTVCAGAPVASYSRTAGTGGAAIQVDPAGQVYRVDWPTTGIPSGVLYRVRVLLGGHELGYADAEVPAAGETAASLRAQGIVPLGNASRLPIRFRLEPGAASCAGAQTYNAGANTLPEAQGWTHDEVVGGNPLPVVTNGLLVANNTQGGQHWHRFEPFSFAGEFTLEARLRVLSSNYVPNIGTGTREGYYLYAIDNTLYEYTIGIASTGFNINTVSTPNQPLTPYPVADGQFHTFRLAVRGGDGTLSIDGVPVATAAPIPLTTAPVLTWRVSFGGHAGASRSLTELSYVCYRIGS